MWVAIAATAFAAAPPKIVVMDLQTRVGVTHELAQTLTDQVTADVRRRRPDASVLGSDDVRSMLGFEKQKAKLGCTNLSCLSEIGGALGASLLVVGSIAKLGQTYSLDLRLIDVTKATVLRESERKLKGKDDDDLFGAVTEAVGELFSNIALPATPAPPLAAAPTGSPAPPAATTGAQAKIEIHTEAEGPFQIAFARDGVPAGACLLTPTSPCLLQVPSGLDEITYGTEDRQKTANGLMVDGARLELRHHGKNGLAKFGLIGGIGGGSVLSIIGFSLIGYGAANDVASAVNGTASGGTSDAWGWTSLAAGVAVLVGGIILYVVEKPRDKLVASDGTELSEAPAVPIVPPADATTSERLAFLLQ